MRKLAREKRLARRRTDGSIAMMVGKARSFSGKAVKVRRHRTGIALRTKYISGMVVRKDVKQIGLTVSCFSSDCSSRNGANNTQPKSFASG
jgi:hypothetical protein